MKKSRMKELNELIREEFSDKELVLGDGSVDNKIVLIGEAPGSKEVELKKPFVGQAGKYLEEFLEVLQLDRKDLYITNTVKFRPTRLSKKTGKKVNRPPIKKEINVFKNYLFRELDIVDPTIIVTLGNVPLKTVMEEEYKIGDVHGKLMKININNKSYRLLPLYHPAAVIYRKKLKEIYLNDLEKLKDILNGLF